jgi:hypothetical protein
VTRKLTATEVKISLANLGRIPPDDVDAYVVVYVKGTDISGVLTNADSPATIVSVLARAIEHQAAVIYEDQHGTMGM